MPATRSAGARPRQNLRDNVDPCEICGIIISRKGDMSRHAKTHATNDADKLPCPLEGCKFRTLQKSNLVTHINRHKKEKPYICIDCKFKTCDPASLLRHRKQIHGYIPRRKSVGYKVKKPDKHVPIRLINGIDDLDSSASNIASQFSTFSSTVASTSAAASSSRPRSPLPSPTPMTLPLFPSPHLSSRHQSHHHDAYLFPPTNAFGESEEPTVASTSHHEFTPERPSPTVLSTTSYPAVYADAQSYHHQDSLLFAPPTDDYNDHPFTSVAAEPWDGSTVPAPSHHDVSENLEYQHPEPEEVVDSTISEVQELELNIPPPADSESDSPDNDSDPTWPGIYTSGQLIGPDGFPLLLDTQYPDPPPLLPYTTQVIEQHPIHAGLFNETHHDHMPIGEEVHRNEYDYPTHYQLYSAPSPLAIIVPNPLDYPYQPYLNPSPHEMYPSPHNIGADLGYYDMVSLDGNDQNYHWHGFNTVSPYVSGFSNPFFVAQDDDVLYMNLELAWD